MRVKLEYGRRWEDRSALISNELLGVTKLHYLPKLEKVGAYVLHTTSLSSEVAMENMLSIIQGAVVIFPFSPSQNRRWPLSTHYYHLRSPPWGGENKSERVQCDVLKDSI